MQVHSYGCDPRMFPQSREQLAMKREIEKYIRSSRYGVDAEVYGERETNAIRRRGELLFVDPSEIAANADAYLYADQYRMIGFDPVAQNYAAEPEEQTIVEIVNGRMRVLRYG